MEREADLREQVMKEYRDEVEKYLKYIPWLQQKAGAKVSSTYTGEGIGEHSVKFPVYDSMVLGFVKELSKSKFMNRNYPYVYSKNGIRTLQDEKRIIGRTGIRDMDILCGILSKYVLGGMTKGKLWSVAVEEGIFLSVLLKMKEIMEFWDKPLA